MKPVEGVVLPATDPGGSPASDRGEVPRWRVLDLVEGFQLSHAVFALHDLGLLAALDKPASASELAARFGLDEHTLGGVLEYVAARTDLLRRTGRRFVATRSYTGGARFLLDLYAGAYAENAARLPHLLRDPSAAPAAVDRARHARAFGAVGGAALGVLPEIVRQLGLNHLLDIGCGNGALLLELAGSDPDFVGWGLDVNPAMCRIARARFRDAGLGRRVRVLSGDSSELSSVITKGAAASIRSVSACNVANEMFREGGGRAVRWLRGIRKVLPGRPLLVADYYGRLGRKGGRAGRETLLHDYAQLISGQGVPPPSLAAWRYVYERAGCKLAHVIEDTSTTRFVHLLIL